MARVTVFLAMHFGDNPGCDISNPDDVPASLIIEALTEAKRGMAIMLIGELAKEVPADQVHENVAAMVSGDRALLAVKLTEKDRLPPLKLRCTPEMLASLIKLPPQFSRPPDTES